MVEELDARASVAASKSDILRSGALDGCDRPLERLDAPTLRTEGLGLCHELGLAFGRQHEDGAHSLGRCQEPDSVHSWHVHVTDHDRDARVGAELLGTVLPVERFDELETGLPECEPHLLPDGAESTTTITFFMLASCMPARRLDAKKRRLA
jgi:hypothetical protein